MDEKKKKIVAIALFAVFMTVIVLFVWYSFFPSVPEDEENGTVNIQMPRPDPSQFVDESKLSAYAKSKVEKDEIGGLLAADRLEREKLSGFDLNLFQEPELAQKIDSSAMTDAQANMSAQEMELLLQLQEEQNKQEQYYNYVDQNAGYAYSKASQQGYTGNANNSENANIPPQKNTNKGEVPKDLTLSQRWENSKINQDNRKFNGANGFRNADNPNKLIACETVDQRLVKNGSTVAIRLKEPLYIIESNLTIPKDAILYGKTAFAGLDRMNINISYYKINDENIPLNVRVFDFDGLEGVHLDNNSWPKIPGKVVKDIYQYARQKGLNPGNSFSGSNNDINLDELKTIAQLSAANEVLLELIERKKVFLYKKYHLWINVNTTD